MEFKEFKELFQKNFKKISKDSDTLFEVAFDKDEFYNLYLDSFPAGTNEVLRERREFDCSCCRNFLKNFGNVVIVKDGAVQNVWQFETGDSKYQPVIDALAEYVNSKEITDIYVTKEAKIGTNKNLERHEDGSITTWHHFYLELPKRLVSNHSKTIDTIKGDAKSLRGVFKRSLDEISIDSVDTVLELINQNSLYKGEEWKTVLEKFLEYQRQYATLTTDEEKELFAWERVNTIGGVIGRIRNHSMGTLLTNISEGMDLDLAVKKYEAIVAPDNYKRPKPIFTKKMLEDAKKTVADLGYMDSLPRRFSNLDDITPNNILFTNKDSAKRIGGDVFDEMVAEVAIDPKKFSKVEEVPVQEFIGNVLPKAKELEIFIENRHNNQFVSLIAPQNKEAPTMFKWDNPFSWAYSGNITDSSMKDRVKSAGGSVEGVLRFSIQWNDYDFDKNDLDAHCVEPKGNHIYFQRKTNRDTSGQLDVDIIDPKKGVIAVENITWSDITKMEEGTYRFFVRNYSNRGGRRGFRAEIEFAGEIFEFDYDQEVREDVPVAEVTYSKTTGFSIKEKLPSSTSSRKVWNVDTNQFVPVSVTMYSPNYWDEQEGIGHRHVFFMLKDCINDEKPNGFYNEFLKRELEEHKRVFAALGSKMAVADVEDQLSGVGFSTTKRGDVLVKVKGATERIIRVKF